MGMQSLLYGGPEGRPSRTFPRDYSVPHHASRTFPRDCSVPHRASRTFPRERLPPIVNVPSRLAVLCRPLRTIAEFRSAQLSRMRT